LKSRGSDVDKTISAWRENVIRMHHKYVEPTKYISDLIIPWGGDKENLIPIKAISGALEYAIYSGKNKK
jgi:uridine kinase